MCETGEWGQSCIQDKDECRQCVISVWNDRYRVCAVAGLIREDNATTE